MQMRLLAMLLLVGCGRPDVGDKCRPVGAATCQNNKLAFFCEAPTILDTTEGSLEAFGCTGPLGCIAGEGGRAICDFHGSAAGWSCPSSLTGKAFCFNAVMMNECVGAATGSFIENKNRWESTQCPGGCSEVGNQVTCKQ